MTGWGAYYTYVTNSDFVAKVQFKTSSGSTAVSANFTYNPYRDLVDTVENKREVTTAETISKYQYQHDALGRRTLDARRRTSFASLRLQREALAACQGPGR